VNVGLVVNLALNLFQQRNQTRRHQICSTDRRAAKEPRIGLNAKSLMSNLKQACDISAPTNWISATMMSLQRHHHAVVDRE